MIEENHRVMALIEPRDGLPYLARHIQFAPGESMAKPRATHFVIGVDSNQNGVKPGFVLTSMVKRVDNAVYDIVKEVVEGRFKGGFHVYGLESDGVGYVVDDYNRTIVSSDAIAAAEKAKKKIIAGEIKVTDAMAQ